MRVPTLTTTAGAPIADNQNSLTAGPRGPLLLQDYQLIEKLAHQNRERIPERVVHAKIFAKVGSETPLVARFSTVAGELGAADAERDVRGFAVKFYTEEVRCTRGDRRSSACATRENRTAIRSRSRVRTRSSQSRWIHSARARASAPERFFALNL